MTTSVRMVGFLGVYEEFFKAEILTAFRASFPDIEVDYVGIENSAQILQRLQDDQAGPQADVVLMDMVFAKKGTDLGLFEPLSAPKLPAMADLAPSARIEGLAAVPFTFDTLSLIYDKRVVRSAPTSWSAFAEPSYSGTVAISDPPGMTGLCMTVIYDRIAGGADAATFPAGIETLAKIAPGIKSFEQIDYWPLVASGEISMSPAWNARAQKMVHENPAGHVGVAMPVEGTVRQVSTISLLAAAPQREAALVFMNFLIGARAQSIMTEGMFYAPVNAKVKPSDRASKKIAGEEMSALTRDLNMIALAAAIPWVTEQWNHKVFPAASPGARR